MSKTVKIYNTKAECYLVCEKSLFSDETYHVRLDSEVNDTPSFYETWTLVGVVPDESTFFLRMEPLDANLIAFYTKPNDCPIARAVKAVSASPVELIYNAYNKTIITNAGSASLYLSSKAEDVDGEVDMNVYFTPDVAGEWEIK